MKKFVLKFLWLNRSIDVLEPLMHAGLEITPISIVLMVQWMLEEEPSELVIKGAANPPRRVPPQASYPSQDEELSMPTLTDCRQGLRRTASRKPPSADHSSWEDLFPEEELFNVRPRNRK